MKGFVSVKPIDISGRIVYASGISKSYPQRALRLAGFEGQVNVVIVTGQGASAKASGMTQDIYHVEQDAVVSLKNVMVKPAFDSRFEPREVKL